MGWAGHVALVGDWIVARRVLVGIPEGKRQQEDLVVDGRIIKIYFQKVGWGRLD